MTPPKVHSNPSIILIHDHEPIKDDLEKCFLGGISGKVYLPVLDIMIQPDSFSTGSITRGWAKHAFLKFEETFQQIKETNNKVFIATSAEDFIQAQNEGRLAILLGSEGGKLIEGSLDLLYKFYNIGYRWMQLTWAFPNQIARFNEPSEGPGLSAFGNELIKELNRLGVIIDIEHAGYQTFWQTLELSKHPIVMSHGGAHGALRRSRHPEWNQNSYGCFLDDDMLKALAEKRGLLGINFFGPLYFRDKNCFCDITLDDVLDHFEYVAELVGPEILALGCDFFPTYGSWAELQYQQNSPPDHFVLPKEHLYKFSELLLNRGWKEKDIKKVLSGNFLRVCQQVFGK